jgi:hypothetical protein
MNYAYELMKMTGKCFHVTGTKIIFLGKLYKQLNLENLPLAIGGLYSSFCISAVKQKSLDVNTQALN